ncbi:alpha/beta-hydrolase [Sistotremastrum suecicum HHB10207 ss-3]|uniref:Alpha/beta-hydrolase n=1 Tax=Sistotremastrum suecicum HHB10207 ss-3 TaxID=1314776 RepID=A0A165XKH0_9AGAM|nr:alpha/beta-hydrolase [Sistotremastrum suecicum HHB10207 ss-3]
MSFAAFTQNLTPVTSGAQIFSYYRAGLRKDAAAAADRPLIILIHGYPQTHLMWRDFVHLLPTEWDLFIADLPGYGNSIKAVDPASSYPFSKRAMAKDILEAADQVHKGSKKVIAYGHDRGARVSYTMALTFPDRVVGAALLDIVPTVWQWHNMNPQTDHKETLIYFHWVYLAAPRPIPETMISHDPRWYFNTLLSGYTKDKPDSAKPSWITDLVEPHCDPERGPARVAAGCEDYRAGATFDIQHDRESGIDPTKPQSPVFNIPVLVLASAGLRNRHDVDGIWGSLVPEGKFRSYQVDNAGHFFVNEQPEEVARRTKAWLGEFFPETDQSLSHSIDQAEVQL